MKRNLKHIPGFMLVILVLAFAPISTSQANTLSTTLPTTQGNNIEQVGPPWLDEAWQYRRPVIISNTGTYLAYYQVLIKLDQNNFNFSLANSDGSDIRFTDSSGRTPISFWIESWDSQAKIAYIWVLVSSLSPDPFKTTIYLYYHNPSAPSASNGITTFDFFDDFLQFSNVACTAGSTLQDTQPFSNVTEKIYGLNANNQYVPMVNPWCVLRGTPTIASGTITLDNKTTIKSVNLFQYQALGYRANYGLGSGYESVGFYNGSNGAQSMIGDLASTPSKLYLKNFPEDNSAPLGVSDWHDVFHTYELRWEQSQSTAFVDHNHKATNTLQVPASLLPITLDNNDSVLGIRLKVDWLYVRQYRNNEPTFDLGIQQSLIDLMVQTTDSPDPIAETKDLTYTLTVTNNSTTDVHDIVLTDTLPTNVANVRVNPTQSCSVAGKVVTCSISLLEAGSSTIVIIVVNVVKTTATEPYTIINTTIATSFDYDKDLSNNISQEDTWVDVVPPTISWVQPTTLANIFISRGGPVTLLATASDNDQVAYVDFFWYNNGYILIAKVTNPPYTTIFNTDQLIIPGYDYFFEARAYDRAGNVNPNNSRAYIYIRRVPLVFLPFIRK